MCLLTAMALYDSYEAMAVRRHLLYAEKMAEVVLLSVLWIGFSASPLQISLYTAKLFPQNNHFLHYESHCQSAKVDTQTSILSIPGTNHFYISCVLSCVQLCQHQMGLDK